MSTHWTIESHETEQVFSDLNLSLPVRHLVSQGTDTVTFVEYCDATAVGSFVYNDSIIIRRGRTLDGDAYTGGTQWFAGTVMMVRRFTERDREGIEYVIEGHGRSWPA